jgi:hypothetical protein
VYGGTTGLTTPACTGPCFATPGSACTAGATLATGAPQQIAFLLAYPDAFLTTAADGTRSVTGGSYGVAVSGHQPDDALGAAQSNVVATAVTLPAAAAGIKFVL